MTDSSGGQSWHDRPSTVVRDIVAVSRARQLSVKAAGLAFHGFNTIVPLVILVLVGVSIADAAEPLLDAFENATGLDETIDRESLTEAVGDGGQDRGRAAILAVAIFLWSLLRSFNAVNSTFTAVYGSRKSQSPRDAVWSLSLVTASFLALFCLTLVLGVVFVGVLGVSLSLLLPGRYTIVLTAVALAGVLTVVFFPMYYWFPNETVSVREAVPGTVFAALGWTVLAVGFRAYVATAESVALFGIAGAVLVILTWVYFGAFFVLVGTVINAVLAGRVDPDDEWVPVDERPLDGV